MIPTCFTTLTGRPRRLAWFLLALLVFACQVELQAQTTQARKQLDSKPKIAYVEVVGGSFSSLLAPDGKQALATVGNFAIRVVPVSTADFARFTTQHPKWRKSEVVSGVLADGQYLRNWSKDLDPDPATLAQPVTNISWFAAAAYCATEGGRLPTWHEWEYVAAADANRKDARSDPVWRSKILDWYGQASKTLPVAGQTPANLFGVRDLHGVIWEWVDDFGALMVSGDNRTQGDPDTLQFCGAGALSANDRENYPVLMRMAMLSSLSAASTNRNLGFRCVRPAIQHVGTAASIRANQLLKKGKP